jgi:Na+-driven multidrug efflux pump
MVMVVFTRTIRSHSASELEALNATAAIGIVNGVAILMLMPIFGLCGGSQPIFGFNYGAERYGRVREIFWLTAKVATAVCTAGAVIIQLFAPWIVRAFTHEATLVELATPALRRMTLGFPLIGVPMMTTTYFQSVGKPRVSIFLSLLRQAMLLIPLIVLLPRVFGIPGIWTAPPISDLLTACVVWAIILREMRRLK